MVLIRWLWTGFCMGFISPFPSLLAHFIIPGQGAFQLITDGTCLRSRSSARCRSTGVVLTDSSVQSAMAKVVNRAEAWADTHWMIYWTRKVAKTTPMPAQESWSHQGSLGLVSLVGGSPTRASATSCDSVTALWSVDGATLGGWSIIPALPA